MSNTFAAQEVPLVPIDWLPNQMNDPMEMGRYIAWLSDAIVALISEGNTRKCLKRCASLSRVLFEPKISDKIATLADETTVLLRYKLNELSKLSAMLRPFEDNEDNRPRELLKLLMLQEAEAKETLNKRGGAPDKVSIEHFNVETRLIADQLLSRVRPGHAPTLRRAV